tara:strand:- start:1257 stop:3404 length:2148 start_codon:yes stop_codon:yes gene_type:complete
MQQVICALSKKTILPGKSAVAVDGLTYDRNVIISYVRKNGKSPITKEPLKISDIIFETEFTDDYKNSEKNLDGIRSELNDILELSKQEPNFEKFPSDINVILKTNTDGTLWKCYVESSNSELEIPERVIKTIKYNVSNMHFYIKESKSMFTTKLTGNDNLTILGSPKNITVLNNIASEKGYIQIHKYSSFTKQYLVKKWVDGIFVDEIMSKPLRVILDIDANKSIEHNINYPLSHLNKEQASVFSSKNFKSLEVVEGPPGTGKTSVISTTLDFVDKINFNTDTNKHYTIVISEKNRGVDAVSERLSPYQYEKVLSFGSDSMGTSTIPYLIENKLQYNPIVQEQLIKRQELYQRCDSKIRKLKRLIYNDIPRKISQYFNWNDLNYIKFHINQAKIKSSVKQIKINTVLQEINYLIRDISIIDNNYQTNIDLAKENYKELCNIILVTFGSLHQVANFLKDMKKTDYSFTFVIDEASTLLSWQGLYLEHFINEVGGTMINLILLGDSKQCAPYYPDHDNPNIEKKSFLDMAKSKCDPIVLKRTYRIPKQVMTIMNKLYYYNTPLTIGHDRKCQKPISWIHCENSPTQIDPEVNEVEAQLVIKTIIKFVPIESLTMILTPYKRQCDLISSLCASNGLQNVAVMTIDASQGHEAEIVCISLVKKQPTTFLSDKRTNVMISRAREKLIVFGNRQECLNCQNEAIRLLARNIGVKNLQNLKL